MRRNTDGTKRNHAETLYNSSGGNFDNEAKEALKEIDKIKNPTPADDFRAGNILEFNVLQGHVDGHGEANRMPLDAMLVRYTRAVGELGRQIGEHENIITGGQINLPIGVTIIPIDTLPMINHLDELVEQVAADLMNPIAAGFMNVVATEGPVIKQVSLAQRKSAAKANAKSKVEEVDNFLEKSREWKPDPQNVHDSAVNAGLRETLAKLKQTCSVSKSPAKSLDEAKEFAKKYLQGEKLANALKTIETISSAGFNSSLHEAENNIFMYVWERSNIPENEENSRLIKEAIVEALADSIDKHSMPVCMNGRCARFIEALTLLDYDKETSAVLTTEMIRNNVFDRVRKMFDTEIDNAKVSSDPEMKKIGEYYAGDTDEPVDDKPFKDIIKDRIDIILEEHARELTPVQLDNLRKECLAAL